MTGKPSMSARSNVTGPGFAPVSVASIPVVPDSRAKLAKPRVTQLALDERCGLSFLQRKLGMSVKVAAVASELARRNALRHG